MDTSSSEPATLAVGRMVRWARKRAGMTQGTLATAAGVPQPTVARIEKGTVLPRTATLITLLRATGYELSLEPILGIDVDREPIRERLRLAIPLRTRQALKKGRSSRTLRRLRRFGVRFVLVGSWAEVSHGAPGEIDPVVQVSPARDPVNLERLATALGDLGVTASGDQTTFKTDAGPLELTTGFDALWPNATKVMVDTGLLVRVAALDDLIRARRAGDRPGDREALERLVALRDELDAGMPRGARV